MFPRRKIPIFEANKKTWLHMRYQSKAAELVGYFGHGHAVFMHDVLGSGITCQTGNTLTQSFPNLSTRHLAVAALFTRRRNLRKKTPWLVKLFEKFFYSPKCD